MLATNRYADVDAQLDTQLLEGFRKDNDVRNYEYYEDIEEEENGSSVQPREITKDSIGRNSVGKDITDFGEAKRPVQAPCTIQHASNISHVHSDAIFHFLIEGIHCSLKAIKTDIL